MLGLEGSDTVILSVGQMEGRKGFDGSLAAFAGEAKGAVYRLLGGGSRLQLYRERVRDLGLGERVRLPGEVDEETVARYLAAADWFWHPAVADPSPLVCVEALHAGLPMCISLQTGNLPER